VSVVATTLRLEVSGDSSLTVVEKVGRGGGGATVDRQQGDGEVGRQDSGGVTSTVDGRHAASNGNGWRIARRKNHEGRSTGERELRIAPIVLPDIFFY
jgi:hypothetical protein